MATRWARLARGWIAASAATLIAALGHGLMGGGTPGLLSLLLALTFSGLICTLLAGRTLSLGRLSASVLLSQVLFHALFTLGAGGAATMGADATGTMTMGHAGHAQPMMSLMAQHPHAHDLMMAGPMMWAGHLAAAIVTIVALRHGERAFWRLCSGVRIRVTRLTRMPVPVPLHTVSVSPTIVHILPSRIAEALQSRMRWRGPPVVALG